MVTKTACIAGIQSGLVVGNLPELPVWLDEGVVVAAVVIVATIAWRLAGRVRKISVMGGTAEFDEPANPIQRES